MKHKSRYSSILSNNIFLMPNDYSIKLNIPINIIIENAIIDCIEMLKKAEYINSFKKAKDDKEIISLT